ncbi:hypothetical protein [Ignatzschineria sp. LJL83]
MITELKNYERFAPYYITLILISVICAIYFYYPSVLDIIKIPEKNELFSASLSLFGILLGFLATTKTILLSFKSKVVTILIEEGLMTTLIGYISLATWACFCMCVLNIIFFFLEKRDIIIYSIWGGATTFSLLLFIRVAYLVLKVLNIHYKNAETIAKQKKEDETKRINKVQEDVLGIDANP